MPHYPAPRVPVSAPVSRSGGLPSRGLGASGSRVVLSPEEREAARLSGVSEADYARQKASYQRKVASGEYSKETAR